MDKEKKNLLVFGYGLGGIAAFFAIGGTIKHGFGLPQQVLTGCSFIFAVVTALNWRALRPGYKGWMIVAQAVGGVVTTFILSVVFFTLFVPVGLFFRLIGKDHLDRKRDPAAKSYWRQRSGERLDPEQYTQQF